MTTIKPIYQSTLYAVIRFNGRYSVVLNSKLDAPVAQFSGAKSFCIEWIRSNDE